ncbi:MAG: hypothetical protein EB163_03165 [Nitrososphaeria archaeon]|nr:hypothetical protein [Nitrososphaeria archaeon]NDB46281.1 hypothetical protein [Nitrososphaeria archaeon]NDB89779.1 hypothetical protein [Nitrososphaerota archaeon]NDF26274.1 hypothetical protein [Nitrosopumilaceae archaeon]
MNKRILFALFLIPIIAVLFLVQDPFAVAKPQTKLHFTKTFSSSSDPSGKPGQFALVLSPNKESIYAGTLTFTANSPIEIIVLHEIPSEDVKGQPIWSVDRKTVYAVTQIEPKNGGTFEFTGSAVAFRSASQFVVTATVDAWIRGKPVELVSQTYEIKSKEVTLTNQNIPVSIPMRAGFFEKQSLDYILTDSSNQTISEKVSLKQGWPVKFAPKLRWIPSSALDTAYVFTNGIKGDGIYGYQNEVFSSTPLQKQYSPLNSIALVSWKAGQKAQVLQSSDDVLKAEKDSRLKITKTNVTINTPQITWPGGKIPATNSTNLNDVQVLKIDNGTRKVTFVAHRSWGPDGRTTYVIIPDATPKGPADIMKIPVSGKLASLAKSTISDMYQFKNGLRGSGTLGFQPNVISNTPDQNYIPVCRVSIVEWKEENSAMPLETLSDIESKKSDGSIYVAPARPLSEDHIVNCPIVEPRPNKG